MKARFLALAALVLGLASCQTEPEGLDVNVGGEVETTVCVSLPEATRANSAVGAFENLVSSPDYTIRYIFQVFYEGTESQAARQVIYTDSDQVSFPVRLVPGRHYNFVVWADVTTTAGKTLDTIHNLTIAEAAAADIHYNTENLKSVAIIDNSWVAMDETRDAFTGHFDTAVDGNKTTYNGAKSINFTLTRPFAKLRVITTDMEQLNDLGIEPTEAAVAYTTDLYSSFNAFAGAVNTATMTKAHSNFDIKVYGDNVDDESMVLFTDYFFAKSEAEVVNFTLSVYDENGEIIGTETNFNTPIPAQRNYLTTIQGPILTDPNNITVTIDKDFAGYHNAPVVDTTEALAEAVANAKNGDIIHIAGEVTMPYFIDKALTFVGISDNAVVKQSPATHIDAFYAGATLNFENLTLVGEAYQNGTQGYQKAVKETYKGCHFVNYIMFAGDVTTVTDCTFENEGQYFWTGTADNITFTDCVFNGVERAVKVCTVGNAGARTVTFNNCQFSATTKVKSAIEIDGSKGSSYIVNINDCTATGFNVSDFTGESLFNIEGAENVKVYIDGNEWLEKGVVKDEEGNYIVNSLTALDTAIKNAQDGDTIALNAGEYVIPDSAVGKTITFVGTGAPEDTLITAQNDGAAEGNCDYSLRGSKATFENVTITTTGTYYPGYAGCQGTYKNCIINGVFTLYDSSSFEDCTFNISGDLYNVWTWGAAEATFTNCTFNCDGKAMLLYGQANTKLTMNNCVFNDNGDDTVTGKAAIEIGNDYNMSYELTVNNATVNGFAINPNGFVTGTTLWANKNSMPADKLKVTVDGKNAYNYVVAADDTQSFTNAINNGATEVALSNGNYTMPEPDLRGKTLTISGTKDVVIDATAVDARDQFVTGASLSFEGVTINFGKDLYMGFANTASLKYKDCDINGLQFLFGENVEFENCTFNSNGAEHSVWTYGVKNVSFTECDFTYGDRCVNCYSENGDKQTVNFTKCTFTTENTASEGAVEINSCFFSVGIEVNLDGCTAPAYGAMAYVSPWDSTNGAKTTINIK